MWKFCQSTQCFILLFKHVSFRVLEFQLVKQQGKEFLLSLLTSPSFSVRMSWLRGQFKNLCFHRQLLTQLLIKCVY